MTTASLSSKTVLRKKVWTPSCNFWPRDSIDKTDWSKQNHVICYEGTPSFLRLFLLAKAVIFQ